MVLRIKFTLSLHKIKKICIIERLNVRIQQIVLVKGVTGFYWRLWNHLCFSHDVCIGRYHQNRQNLSANSFNTMRKSAFAAVKGAFAPSLAIA